VRVPSACGGCDSPRRCRAESWRLADFFLGYGGRAPKRPDIQTTAKPANAWRIVAQAHFTQGTGQWSAELQSGGTVAAQDGVLDIDVPGGASSVTIT
jgi:hypothetical protein